MEVEDWDQDFEGGFSAFAGNVSIGSVAQTSISSRLSVHSESVAGGDDDWNLVLEPDNEKKAIQSAQQAGIPLPNNVPASALLGGTIKRLGKKKSRQKVNDDWENDIEMPDGIGALQLKPQLVNPLPATPGEEQDEFDELEGSLGIRFAGTKRDGRNRSSSVSAMSPSLGSVTMESEDEMGGIELPEGPVDFEAILKKRRAADAELSDLSQPSPALEQPATMNVHKKSKLLSDENDDFLNDFDLGGGDVLDSRKRTINKNIKIKNQKPSIPVPRAPATTINFHDKPVDKPMHTRSHIPRPVSGSKPAQSRLEPVLESGPSTMIPGRRQPTTTGAQLLRSKRSMPVLRSQQPTAASTQKQPAPFVPGGAPSHQPHYTSSNRSMPYHLRRDSDPHRAGAQSPPPRSQSRLSNAHVPDTPSRGARQRQDLAPTSLVREAAAKRTVTKPARRRNYGDGNELEIFDELPTDTAKESKFVKAPVARGPPKPLLRQMPSRSDIRDPFKRNSAIPERMVTPAPPRTPASPTKGFYDATPSYLRDTAASRIARESRLQQNNNARPRSDGPLMPLSTNWKAQVAARSPHTSPSAQRNKTTGKRVQPQLIKGIGAHVPKTEKGMVYNPLTLRWEGNENTLSHFDMPPPLETPTPTGGKFAPTSYMDRQQPHSSPPRPALIAPMSAASGIQVNGGMVFDPRRMTWLKLKEGRDVSGPLLSPSVTDAAGEEEDAFAGIDDLKDEASPAPGGGSVGMASPVSLAAQGAGEIHEEFDLGPKFIETQMAEEANWRRRCGGWFEGVDGDEPRMEDDGWRWGIREMVRLEGVL